MDIDFRYFFSIFLRRSPYFVGVLAVFASIGLTLALILPPEYRARATLLVENAQIPEDLAASTVQTGTSEQLRVIEQRLLSRESLLDIATRLELYVDPETGRRTMSTADIVGDMRARATFQQQSAGGSRRDTNPTTILTISFRSEDRNESAEVTNELVTLVLEENVQIRTAQATDTLEFFEQEVDRLSTTLDNRSAQLLEFQMEAGVAVPSNIQFLRSRLNSLEDRLESREREIIQLEDQRDRLVTVFEATGGLADGGQSQSPLELRLASAREELFNAELLYSDQNPKLRVLQGRVEQLEERLAEQDDVSDVPQEATSRAQALFDAQLSEIDAGIEALEKERVEIEQEMQVVTQQITEATENGVALSKLERDVENARQNYRVARDRLSAAQTGERIELLAKGQRISVIEQAVPPGSPDKPNRPLIAAAGVGAGMAAGLALIVLLELLNKSIRRPVELTNALGITPIAVVPYIRTEREVAIKRMSLIGVLLFFLVVLPGILFVVHSFVVPLDTALEPLVNRIGFSIAQ